MSGDVQPKKRRDKRKRKEDLTEEVLTPQHQPTVTAAPVSSETNIHVHKEKTVGGGVCAKCVFFTITVAIAVIIGLTIMEHRGITDIDIPLSESRFASIFDGWIDTGKSIDDDHDEGIGSEEASHEKEDDDETTDSIEDDEEEEEDEVEESEQETTEQSEETSKDEDDTEEDDQIVDTKEEEEDDDDDDDEESQEQQTSQEEVARDEGSPEDEEEEKSREILQSVEENGKSEEIEENDIRETDKQPELREETSGATSTGGVGNPDDVGESDEDRRRTGAKSYELDNITNDADYLIREELDYAQQQLPNNVAFALNLFTKILASDPDSPRGLYGRAQSLDLLAEQKRSNEILLEAIKYFQMVLNSKNVPDALFVTAADRCIQRMRFIGHYAKAVDVHKKLVERFPDKIEYRNDYAVTLLTVNKIQQARVLLQETLRKWPENGFALVHYGFILKTADNNLPVAIDYLSRGIKTREPKVIDGRFYFHLGDALARLGRNDEAMKIYEDGVANRVFLSKYQRSLYNVDRLKGKPWWDVGDLPYAKLFESLQQNWRKIRSEGLSALNEKGYFKDESENLKDVGDWKQFELFARGIKNKENCKRCPLTCQIIDNNSEAKGCRRGQVKFSVMHPGTHVWPHCGPTNCRLRVHLGLKVPPKTFIRVAEETRSWEDGKLFVFDDSFEHEVWHNGTEYRLVLIVDVWHPELTKSERINLSPI